MEKLTTETWNNLQWDEGKVQFLRERLAKLRDRFPDRCAIFSANIASLEQISSAFSAAQVSHTSPANYPMLQTVFSKVHTYLLETQALCDDWELRSKLSLNKAVELMMLTAKFETLGEMIPKAEKVPLDDLFCVGKTDKRWERLQEIVNIVVPRDPEEVERGIRKMSEGLIFGNAVVGRGFECADARAKEVVIGAGTVLYRLSKKKTRTQALMNYAKPSRESILALWNMLDSVLMAPLIERGLMDIPLTKVIHIPRTSDTVLQTRKETESTDTLPLPSFSEEARK